MGIARLWIETDVGNDVDDMGALAVAHALADRGEAEIVGIGVNMPDRSAAVAVAAVNAFYGRPGIPIGVMAPGDDRSRRTYADVVAERFPQPDIARPLAATLLRATLDAAGPASITLVSIGMHDNLVELLDQEGGADAIRRAVVRTIVMAGAFPEGDEFNLSFRPDVATRFVREWPVPIEFLGYEVGEKVITGEGILWPDAAANPVAVAYDAYNGPGRGRSSWDPLTVDLAVRGDGGLYELSAPGILELEDGTARDVWRPDAAGPHRHVVRRADGSTLQARVNALLSAAPRLRDAD